MSNLTNITSNLQAGRGRIEDADFCRWNHFFSQVANFTASVNSDAGQANASKQNVLSLLQG